MNITPDVELSDDIMSQPVAILGRTGSGKTYTAKGIVEQLLEDKRRVCIIDPTGVWWGLRSGKDGKSPGFPVVIFGGAHGDIPIDEHAGAAIGKMVATSRMQCILDLRDLMVGQQHRFVERFFEAVYHDNTQPLHLVVDEADEFGPQSPQPDCTRMLGQFDRIARRGRTRGFRLLSISQRPAKLNKDILGMAATLISMQLTLPHDRKAVELWIKGQADPVAGKAVLDSLPRLKRGEGWVWCPDADVLTRTKFPEIRTFDSSATPDESTENRLVHFADVDLSAMREQIAAATKEAEASDPKRLKERVAELEEQLREPTPSIDTRLLTEENEALAKQRDFLRNDLSRRDGHIESLVNQLDALMFALSEVRVLVNGALEFGLCEGCRKPATMHDVEGVPLCDDCELAEINDQKEAKLAIQEKAPSQAGAAPKADRGPRPRETGAPAFGPGPSSPQASSDLSGPQERILNAIAWWQSIGVRSPTRVQVGFVAGYTATSGTFRNRLAELRAANLIEYSGDMLAPMPAGQRTVRRPHKLADLHDAVKARLSGPQLRLFSCIVTEGRGRELTRTHVAESTGYEASSGTFRNRLAEMKGLGLIRYPKPTTVAASPLLFPEALR